MADPCLSILYCQVTYNTFQALSFFSLFPNTKSSIGKDMAIPKVGFSPILWSTTSSITILSWNGKSLIHQHQKLLSMLFVASQQSCLSFEGRPGHRCWLWRGYHHYRQEDQQASHEYDVDELDQVGRGGSFPFCAVLEKDPGRYFFGTRVVSLEGKSVFSQILDTLWPLKLISCVCTKPRHKFLMKSIIHGCDSISSTYLQKVCYLFTRSFRC